MYCVLFGFWFVLLNTVILSFTPLCLIVAVAGYFLLLSSVSWYECATLCIHSPLGGIWVIFQFLVPLNKGCINSHMGVCIDINFLLHTWNRVTESCDMFKLLKKLLKWLWHFTFSSAVCNSSQDSLICASLWFCHLVGSSCGFSWHFLDD